MAKTRQPGDLLKAFGAKRQKSAGASMPGMDSLKYYSPKPAPVAATKAPAKVTPKATAGTFTIPGTGSVSHVQSGPWAKFTFNKSSKKRKASSVLAPINKGRKAQQAYANKFGTVPVSKKKRKSASKLDMEMAFKGKKSKISKKKATKALMGCA